MTLRYAHLTLSHKVKAVEILEKSLKGKCHVFVTFGQERDTAISVSH